MFAIKTINDTHKEYFVILTLPLINALVKIRLSPLSIVTLRNTYLPVGNFRGF